MKMPTQPNPHEESIRTVSNRFDMYVAAIKPFDLRRIIRQRKLVGESNVFTKYAAVDLGAIQHRSIEQLHADLRSGVLRRDSIERVKLAIRQLSHRKTARSTFLMRALVLLTTMIGFIAVLPRADRLDAVIYLLLLASLVILILFSVVHSAVLAEEAADKESFLGLLDVAVHEYDESLTTKVAA